MNFLAVNLVIYIERHSHIFLLTSLELFLIQNCSLHSIDVKNLKRLFLKKVIAINIYIFL